MPGNVDLLDATFDKASIVIEKEESLEGVNFLTAQCAFLLARLGKSVLTPIKDGGNIIGNTLYSSENSGRLVLNPMKMSHTDPVNGGYLEKAICVEKPKVHKFLGPNETTLPVIFAEAVVETEETIKKARLTINQQLAEYNKENGTSYPYPEYFTFALVSKVDGEPSIGNFVYAFWVSNLIWIRGWGCDDKENGRERGRQLKYIAGRISPVHNKIPKMPYYKAVYQTLYH